MVHPRRLDLVTPLIHHRLLDLYLRALAHHHHLMTVNLPSLVVSF
jgi:hypothetical protein